MQQSPISPEVCRLCVTLLLAIVLAIFLMPECYYPFG